MPTPPQAIEAGSLPLYVLAGGGSKRFGADKATHPIDDHPWAAHVALGLGYKLDAATQVGGPAVLGRYITDKPGCAGPFGGLMAALADRIEVAGPGSLLLASCDLVHPQAEWITPLLDASQERSGAVAYRSADRWQPFPALFHTQALQQLEAAVGDGSHSMQEVFGRLDAIAVDWPGHQAGPPQANTPEELDWLLRGGGEARRV